MKYKALFSSIILNFIAVQGSVGAEIPRELTLKIGYEVGTSHDSLGRIIAPFLQKHLPPNSTITVENIPGASGLVLSRKVSESEPHDGSVLSMIPLALIRNTLIDPKNTPINGKEIKWIGAVSAPTLVCITRKDFPQSWELLKSSAFKMASGVKGGVTYYLSSALKSLYFSQSSIVVGFKSEIEIIASIERKETDAMCGLTLQTFQRMALDDRMKIIGTGTPSDVLQSNGIPYLFSDIGDRDRKALEILLLPSLMFYPFALPPETPTEIVEEFRKVFAKLGKDPDFLAELVRNNYDPTIFDGVTVQTKTQNILKSDYDIIQRAQELAN